MSGETARRPGLRPSLGGNPLPARNRCADQCTDRGAANPHHQPTGHGRATGGVAGVSFTETARDTTKYGPDDDTRYPADEGALSGVVLPGPRLRYLRNGEGRGLRVLYGKRQRIPSDADDLADSSTRGTKDLMVRPSGSDANASRNRGPATESRWATTAPGVPRTSSVMAYGAAFKTERMMVTRRKELCGVSAGTHTC